MRENHLGEKPLVKKPKNKTLSNNSFTVSSHPTTITICNIQRKQDGKYISTNTFLQALMDTGCSNSLIKEEWKRFRTIKEGKKMEFMTGNGVKTLNKHLTLEFTLCEFTNKRRVKWKFVIDDGNHSYDIIIGRDLLCQLGMKLDFDNKKLIWQGMEIQMRYPHETLYQKTASQKNSTFLAHEYNLESQHSLAATDRIQEILTVNNTSPVDFRNWISEIENIKQKERDLLLTTLLENSELFQGDLGTWNCSPVEIELKEGATPYATRPYPVPKIHEKQLKAEIQRFIDLGILKRTLNSEWASPAF